MSLSTTILFSFSSSSLTTATDAHKDPDDVSFSKPTANAIANKKEAH